MQLPTGSVMYSVVGTRAERRDRMKLSTDTTGDKFLSATPQIDIRCNENCDIGMAAASDISI